MNQTTVIETGENTYKLQVADDIRHYDRVTSILKPLINYHGDNEFAKQRGTAVHYATALLDGLDGKSLAWESVPEELEGYLAGWLKFKKECGFDPTGIEKLVYHPKYQYAGRIDRTGILGETPVLLDIIAGAPTPLKGVQLAAYLYALKWYTPHFRHAKLFGVSLNAEGGYLLFPDNKGGFNPQKNWELFKCCISINNWRGTTYGTEY